MTLSKPLIKHLLKIRDALILEDIDAAYRLLYALADPDFTRGRPWEEWGRRVESKEPESHHNQTARKTCLYE